MGSYEHLKVRRGGSVATVQIDRLDQKNALNAPLIEDLTQVARDLNTDADLRAVILTGGPAYFSAGADRAMIEEILGDPDADPITLRHALRAGPDMCQAWQEIEAITIVAIEGFCVGGGCALSVAFDFRIAGKSAAMSLPEVKLGMNMSWQTLPRLVSLIGPARAKQFTLFGDLVPSETLLNWGLIDQRVPDGQAFTHACEWAERVASLPPLPVRMTKSAINAAATLGHHAASIADRDQFLLTAFAQAPKS